MPGQRLLIAVIGLLVIFCYIPGAAAGYKIVIDKSTNQLKLYNDERVVKTFPVATGKNPSLTPEGKFTIASKIVNPYYSKLRIPGGSPQNPLGIRWLGLNLGGGGQYGIHGTNNPSSIGKYASAGCIRMNNKDVVWLYDTVPLGTPVEIYRSGEKKNTAEKQKTPEFRIDPELPGDLKTALKNGMIVPEQWGAGAGK
ncbi:hypothetical protein DCCM_0781 [Desulfocucumis palustris]|uniref:L,D-TPase catalytic domain-containing protein n=1 Tax=Desulfocucumis palustris TaxID=1898651 RepID=A0A2L2X8S4_9FIRM|nr:L,D-transpeptidase [Desulfocucumis palustris]GBF32585.1 hypothetical protein DCCM_0781 [Desulfocucumis palustris]